MYKGFRRWPWLCPACSYVVSLQPRYLRRDWALLRAVVGLLFGCFHEAPLQDAALDAFMQLCMTCAFEFVTIQARSLAPLRPA
jgi:hypothetical protein